jgi:alpha-L-fucosidase 2
MQRGIMTTRFTALTVCLKSSVALIVFAWLASVRVLGQPIPDILPWLSSNNVSWNVPGPTSLQSMPLGNGDIGLNVWVETNGAVDFYIGKTDAWGDDVVSDQGLMKVGGVRVTLSPSPLSSGAPFLQVLKLHEGEIEITEGSGTNLAVIRVWVDANNPVIRVEAKSEGTPVVVQATLLDWRLSASNPDTVLKGQTNYIGWYHRNKASDNSHIAGWTFGAMIQGPGLTNTSFTNLASTLVTNQLVSVYPLTTRTGTTNQWLTQLQSNVVQISALDLETTRASHQAWWDEFWHRSWIFVSGNQDATNTTLGYVLQRFVTACAGRGAYPIKFNGSLFVVDKPTSNPGPYNADGRRWGGQYWMQNTRPMYWPMLESGDFEMMLPFFNMYSQMLSNNAAQVTSFYGHGGSYSAETSPFWGGLSNIPTNAPGNFTLRYYEGVLELSMMMLDFYEYTGDTNFLVNTLLPATSVGLDFYDQHFGLDSNGKMVLYPVNALETYWDTYNPAPDIAGLMAILPRMLALPNDFVSTNNRAKWIRMMAELPPLPTGINGGKPVLRAYTGPFPGSTVQTNGIRNGENAELYAVYPYRIYGLDKANLILATNSYNKRLFKGLGWADWMQDAIQAAQMGLTSEAKIYTVYAMTNREPSLKFPAFWREQNDYEPSENNGAVAQDALQRMIMQTSGKKIMLQPAWPSGWNAIFKLNAPFNTVVQGMITNGVITNLIVTPPSRMADVIFMTGGGFSPAVPTNLIATPDNGPIVLSWNESFGAISYQVKRSTASGGPYATVTNIFDTTYSDASVNGGTTYYYVVSAVNPSGESANSTQANATASLTIPAPPVGLIAVSGDGQVTLNWTASSGATNYNIKMSTVSGSGYVDVGSRAATVYTDTGLSNGTTYYYIVTAENSVGESANSSQVSAVPTAAPAGPVFTSGAFTDNSVLNLIGPPSQEVFGVSLGSGLSRVTANGYSFGGYPSTNVSYGGSGAYAFSGFLGGGGSSGDASFDAVLNNGQLGINSGILILSNLTAGATYNVLFLEADTRSGMGSRSYSIGFGSGAVTSPAQSYAYQAGTPSLGGYILCTFTATAATQAFTNKQAGFGYQLDGVLVGREPAAPFYITLNSVNTFNQTNIVISGGIGPAGGAYRILESTNLMDWFPVATNYFDANGNFTFTNSLDTAIPSNFYRVVMP